MTKEKELGKRKFPTVYHQAAFNISFTGNWMYEKVAELLKPYGISEQQYSVLKTLHKKKGIPVNLQYLNDQMIYKTSNTTRLVEKLRKNGYLLRGLCEHNRRMVEITITEEGLELLKFLDPLINAQIRSALNNLSKNEAEMLSALMAKLRG